jgi:D-hydroxyproline dehydrogenase subunit beta
VDASQVRKLEPLIGADAAAGVWYPQDCQVQPMLAANWLLAKAIRLGARTQYGTEVLAGHGTELHTGQGTIATGAVVNAAGPWSGTVAERLGGRLPVRPRRGHILVTEPVAPGTIRHKVYEADYVGTVVSDNESVQFSTVVEGTRSGTVLIGSSREFAGWDRQPSLDTLAEMARRAAALFPFLAGVRVMRCYVGFRPASPDHLPLIGADVTVAGLFHASGHEGAGIGLAPATGELITAQVTGAATKVDPGAFGPGRLSE